MDKEYERIFPIQPRLDNASYSDRWWEKQKGTHLSFLSLVRGQSLSEFKWSFSLPLVACSTQYGFSRKWLAAHVNYDGCAPLEINHFLTLINNIEFYRQYCGSLGKDRDVDRTSFKVVETLIDNGYDWKCLSKRKAPIRSYLINLAISFASIDANLCNEKHRVDTESLEHLIENLNYFPDSYVDKKIKGSWKASKIRIKGMASKLHLAYDISGIDPERFALLGAYMWVDIFEVFRSIPSGVSDDLLKAGLHKFIEATSDRYIGSFYPVVTGRSDLLSYVHSYLKCRSVHV